MWHHHDSLKGLFMSLTYCMRTDVPRVRWTDGYSFPQRRTGCNHDTKDKTYHPVSQAFTNITTPPKIETTTHKNGIHRRFSNMAAKTLAWPNRYSKSV